MMHYHTGLILSICLLFFSCGSSSEDSVGENLAVRQVEAPKVYQGEYTWEGGQGMFKDCRTDKRYTVGGGKADKQIKRTLFSIDPSQETGAFLEVEGYLAQQLEADSGWTGLVFMVEKLIDLDIQQSCADVGVPITQDSLFIRITNEIELLSQMYLSTPVKASNLGPDTPIQSFLLSEPMQLGLWAFIMAETDMSQQQMMQISDSLKTVVDIYEVIGKKREE